MFASLAEDLHVSGAPAPGVPAPKPETGALAAELAQVGWTLLGGAAEVALCARIAGGVERLLASGLPAVFVYAFDEPWWLGEALRVRLGLALGRPYDLVADVWAWRIPPGGAGWPPHRGDDQTVLDRAAPEYLNTWVALRDVATDQSCMHLVPFDADPFYPRQLGVPASTGARAVPLAAGDALAWNANLSHWGGVCAAEARGPRVSCSFTLARTDVRTYPAVEGASLDFRARLDLVAVQITTYGVGQPDVSPAVMGWARTTLAMLEGAGRFARRKPT